MGKPSAQEIREAAGISRTHAYDILAGRQEPSLTVALAIHAKTGAQFGLLRGCSDEFVAELRRKVAA